MLYVAGEIFLWMALAFVLGLLVGWFVWGLRQRKTTPAKVATAPAAPKSEIESVTVRPVMKVAEPASPAPSDAPVTPPAGQPAVPPTPAVDELEPPDGAAETTEVPVTAGEVPAPAPSPSLASLVAAELAGEGSRQPEEASPPDLPDLPDDPTWGDDHAPSAGDSPATEADDEPDPPPG